MAGDRTAKSQDNRKSSKPLMEKRRRARINECLSELQGILELINQGQTTGSHSKKEKAEILEQTVELVRQYRLQHQTGSPSDPLPQAQYRAGFNACLAEVSRFMEANNSALNPDTRLGLFNHLAHSLRSATYSSNSSSGNSSSSSSNGSSSTGGWTVEQFGLAAGKATLQAQRETGLARRPVLGRGCTAGVSPHTEPSQVPLTSPPKASVPPLVPAAAAAAAPPPPPPPPPPPTSVQSCNCNTVQVQQSPKKGDHPTSASLPLLTSPTPGVTMPVNTLPSPAGHVALVLPAHLLGSFVSGQFTTSQVIPVYQHQGGTPVILQPHSVPNPDAIAEDRAVPSANSSQGSSLNKRCATSPSGINVGAGHVFLVPSPILGCVSSTPSNGRQNAPLASSPVVGRGAPPVSNPPTTCSSLVAMEVNDPNGVVYAPAPSPVQLYVTPSAYGGGMSGPFANGLSLPNPPPTHIDPHRRPWGWDVNREQRPR